MIAPTNSPPDQLPVVIAGAGPCGLVAAYCLQQYGVPFVILERASRSAICSNAGSGFELTPTSVEILQSRLGIDVSKIMSRYSNLGLMTMDGRKLRHAELPKDYAGGSVNRAEMQDYFLKLLFATPEDEDGILLCGSGVDSYRENPTDNNVVVTLQSGKDVTGCVLLACDGIHSRCRAVLHGGYDSTKDWDTNVRTGNAKDPIHFCKAMAYWGKTEAPKGSDLIREFNTMIERLTEPEKSNNNGDEGIDVSGAFAVVGVATSKCPASFFVIPTQNYTMLNWAITVRSEHEEKSGANDGTDLTRRGGGPLNESEKKRLFDFDSHGKNSESLVKGIKNFPFLETLIKVTPAESITEAGLNDRENLNLPFTSDSKLVALLGDSAHPQTPFMGQGVNMAIADAYIYATNIAVALLTKKKSLRQAIVDSDTGFRRKEAKKVVRGAREFCDMSLTRNPFVVAVFRLYAKYASARELVSQIVKTDKSNRHYLKHLDGKICSATEQEALRKEQAAKKQEALRQAPSRETAQAVDC